MQKILVLTLFLIVSGHAGAAYYDTQYLKQLLDSCDALAETFDANQENFSRIKDCGLSTGYILGVFDALDVMAERSKCLPDTLASEQAVGVVERWIREHPERAHGPADKAIEAALDEAWGCRK